MNFDDVIYKRRSIRTYDANKKVSKEQILELIKAAQQAPSWKNSQTARYYAVFDAEKLAEVRQGLALQNQIVTKDVNVGLRDADALRKALNIPETEDVGAVIAVGYRTADVPAPKRKDPEEIVTFC